jgi:energy-coupling factor transporter ATP-binding protein EcfA2
MTLLSFKIANQKSVRLAEAVEIPPVMVIAGPNGIGKSTLLYAIKNGAGVVSANTRLLYQGPHRVLRRTQVQRRWLGGASIRWLYDLLSGGGDVSGYEGLSFPNSSRTPENVDEAGSTIKHTLGKIENRRQAILARVVDKKTAEKAQLDAGSLPDIYEPLKKLTRYLLPHLTFSRIDFENEDNIRCLWRRSDAQIALELDIDDLSSGEKSIVVLFLSLLEEQIRERLQQLENLVTQGHTAPINSEHRVVLIDEPEQHLHPDLQAKILSYMRSLTQDGKVQFIITTHSPTILDQAFDSELFALYPPTAGEGENQLKRVATNAERLETLKQLTGSAYFLTTGRVVVCIEGEPGAGAEDTSDVGLLEAMYPRATAFTLVPTKGKGNVINAVKSLREYVSEQSFRISVRGLVDADRSRAPIEGIEFLPVCMIENFLLDPHILSGFASKLDLNEISTPDGVTVELANIFLAMRDEEIALRVRDKLKGWTIRIGGASVDAIKQAHSQELQKLKDLLPADELLQTSLNEVSTEVDKILFENRASDAFRGKVALKEFHRRHIAPKNISYKQMCIELAKQAGAAGRVAARMDPVFDRLSN